MKAVILGASGLVGSHLLQKLLDSPDFSEVVAFVRRPLILTHSKLKQVIDPLEEMEKHQAYFQTSDIVFCCLGTTIKKAKTKEAFRHVDFELPLKAAKLFSHHFILITALGSKSSSPIYYNKVKGELEDELKKLNLKKLSIVRPSLLLGEREEKRLFEGLGQTLYPMINPLLPSKYKAVTANDVAETLIKIATSQAPCKYGIEVEIN